MKAEKVLENRLENRRRLEEEAPTLYKGFNELMKAYYSPGVLDRKYKELMAITGAVATRCVP